MGATGGIAVRKKRFSNKVRSGCLTCRIRRVKCDEAKPLCQRCMSTGRACDGYSQLEARGEAPKTPLTSVWSSEGDMSEKRAVYMFRTRIALLLASAVDVRFWTYDLLQTIDTCQAVRHAAAALAAAYQANILSDDGDCEKAKFSIEQYNKSLRCLHRCLSEAEPLSYQQKVIILITNLVFHRLCAIQGLCIEACLHLRSGLVLFDNWGLASDQDTRSRDQTPTPTTIEFLAAAYTRLDAQARVIVAADGRNPPWKWLHNEVATAHRDRNVDLVAKAFRQLDGMYDATLQHMVQSGCDRETYPAFKARLEGRHQLQTWDLTFQSLLRKEASATDNSLRALRVHRLLAEAYLELHPESGFSATFRLEKLCREMLALILAIIKDSGFRQGKRAYSPSGNLVESLYFISTHCPNSKLSEQAITCMETFPIIEGIWASGEAAARAINYTSCSQ